jgi:RHS repeat-associated protein
MLQQIAIENALEAGRDSVAEIISEHINKQNCLAAELNERFTASHPTTEHHYTLYYYDQAGNLVQTIPPAGVMPVPTGAFSNGIWNGTEPLHERDYITRYQYNTLGQVVSQRTPDAGETDFHYDRVQRLRFSQNAKQVGEDKYAYTKYDGQSRIIEVGEVTDSDLTDEEINDPLSPASGTQDEVMTKYDEADETPPIPSDNTRGRVARVSNDNMTSYYDYDAHGNVRELTHDIPALGNQFTNDQIITLEYDYDLVSGNVNEFRYEPGELDQFTQRFIYDADNRITSAFSSDDGYVFEEDARYFYYLHGPLARVELGEDKVQGLDYFYTLQGWIKGVNMPGNKPEFGFGLDGDTINPLNNHRFFGTDTMMYSLGYNYADYTPIGGTGLLFDQVTSAFQGLDGNLLGPTNMKGLFNGNISLMLTHNSLATQAMAYQYDALHRITFATSYDWNPGWGASNDYSNPQIIYDPNGNIQRQDILSVIGNELLSYDYYDELGWPNRLKSVSGGGNVTGLGSGDFHYDEIGNLIQDDSEGASMTWDVYGKLRTVIDDGPTIYTYDAMGNRLSKERPVTAKDVYVRDASGNLIALYSKTGNGLEYTGKLKERYLYGSSRLGVDRSSKTLASSSFYIPETIAYRSTRQHKSYELSNHLGNVLTNLSDKKLGVDLNADERANFYGADVLSYADYYPFGLEMPQRTFDPGPGLADLRHGFNGKEKDAWGDSPTNYDYGFRIYNPAIGRFLSVDPLTQSYPFYTPYQFAGNKPIWAVDIDGLEEIDHQILKIVEENISKFNVNTDFAPNQFMGEKTRIAYGRKWNARWTFHQINNLDPNFWSVANQKRIMTGDLPTVDDIYLAKIGEGMTTAQFSELKRGAPIGEVIRHHHMNYGRYAVPLSQNIHMGAGNASFWHKPGFRNAAKGLLNNGLKAFEIITIALLMTDMVTGQPVTILPDMNAEDDFAIDMLEKGLDEQNFESIHIAATLSDLIKVEYLSADDMLRYMHNGSLPGNIEEKPSSSKNRDFPYMNIIVNNQSIGILEIPDDY